MALALELVPGARLPVLIIRTAPEVRLADMPKVLRDDGLEEKAWPSQAADMATIAMVRAGLDLLICCNKLKHNITDLELYEQTAAAASALKVTLANSASQMSGGMLPVCQTLFTAVEPMVTDMANEKSEGLRKAFDEKVIKMPLGVAAFLPPLPPEESYANEVRAMAHSKPVSSAALAFVYTCLGKASHAHVVRGMELASRLRALACRYALAFSRLPAVDTIKEIQNCGWEAQTLQVFQDGLDVMSLASGWLDADVSNDTQANEEYQETVMILSEAQTYFNGELATWSTRHDAFINVACAELVKHSPNNWRELVVRWNEEEIKGEKFMKHPSRSFMSEIIDCADGLCQNAQTFIKKIGTASAKIYQPQLSNFSESIVDSKACLASMHISHTLLKDGARYTEWSGY